MKPPILRLLDKCITSPHSIGSPYDAHPNVTRPRKPLSYRRRFTGFLDHAGKRINGGDVLTYGCLCYMDTDPLAAKWLNHEARVGHGDASDSAGVEIDGWLVGGRGVIQNIGQTLESLVKDYAKDSKRSLMNGGWWYVQPYIRIRS